MSLLPIVLASVGLSDLISGGLSGRPRTFCRAVLGSLLGSLLIPLSRLGAGDAFGTGLVLYGVSAALSMAWNLFRLRGFCRGRAGLLKAALGALSVYILSAAILSPCLRDSTIEPTWAGTLAERAALPLAPAVLGMAVSCMIVLLGTANGIVRCVLDIASPGLSKPTDNLRGGRYIGAIERVLILMLIAGGQHLAAAIVVSAKGLLRFPELTKTEENIAEMTEYLLLGSLASWVLAGLAGILVIAAGGGGI